MRRYRPQSVGKGSPGLPWEVVPHGAAIWRACVRHIQACRYPPFGWSWPDWWEEIESVCLARALEALVQFDAARGVPLVAFLHVQVYYALSERYREETRFGTHCHAAAMPTCELTNHEEDIGSEEGA